MIILVDGYELEITEKETEVYIKACKGANAGQGNLTLTVPGEIDGKPVTEIEKKAFFCVNSLKRIYIPGTVRMIGDWAFSNCPILKEFYVMSTDRTPVLGRGVFDGCTRIETIDLLGNPEGNAARLLGALATKLPAPYLLRDEEIGSKNWFNKWDMALINFLNTDDYEGYSDRALCGEEDISYDGIGSVDGEFLGESYQYIKEVGKNKAGLALLRLLHSEYMEFFVKEKLEEYIKSHSKGCALESAWLYVTEDMKDDLTEFEQYIEIVKPGEELIDMMISDLKADKAHMRAYLINHKSTNFVKKDVFDDFLV